MSRAGNIHQRHFLQEEIALGPGPTGEEIHRAQLSVCAYSEDAVEALEFMKMLGLV